MSPPRHAHRDPAPPVAAPLAWTFGSALLPGLAHLVAGRRSGPVLVFLSCVVWGSLLVLPPLLGRAELLALGTRPRVVALAGVLLAVGLAVWAAVVVHGWFLLRPQPIGQARGLAAFAVVGSLVLTVSVPAAVGVRYAAAQHSLLTTVFGADDRTAPQGPSGVGDEAAPPYPQQRLNILLAGGDGGKGRRGIRTDSMTVASIDTRSGDTVLFSLPRNLEDVRFPAGSPLRESFPRGYNDLLNAVYEAGVDRAADYPGSADPGLTALEEAVGQTLGLPIDYTVLINLDGFSQIIDALGGITLDVLAPVETESALIPGDTRFVPKVIEPGTRKMNGATALAYSRVRETTSDYARMKRQRCVIAAMTRQLDPVAVLRNFTGLTAATKELVVTDIPRSELPALVRVAERVRGATLSSVQFVPPLIRTGNPDFVLIRELVVEALQRSAGTPTASPTPDVVALPSGSASPSVGPFGPSASPSPSGPPEEEGFLGEGPAVTDSVDDICGAA